MSNIVIARLYQDGKLIGVFPRTKEARGTLDDLLSLDMKINDQFGRSATISHSTIREYLNAYSSHINNDLIQLFQKVHEDLSITVHEHTNTGVLVALQTGNFAKENIQTAQDLLEAGAVRTAEKIFDPQTGVGVWQTQLYGVDCMNALFKRENVIMGQGYFDKVPLLTKDWTEEKFKERGIRFIPGSFARAGCWIGYGVTLMPGSIVNSGAYVGEGSVIGGKGQASNNLMVDGGTRVATGAQIGKNVKMGAGSGTEGILEPKGNLPTIVENNVKIGANCELAGIIEEGAIIASGVIMTKQKKIFDLRTGETLEPRYIQVGEELIPVPYIPANRIAVPGVYTHKKHSHLGIACTHLLEKDASQNESLDVPKNPSLYMAR